MLRQSFASVPPSEILPASKLIPRKESRDGRTGKCVVDYLPPSVGRKDLIKLLDVTMKINRILARKQERLDRMYDQTSERL
jgi:hypothetical protein